MFKPYFSWTDSNQSNLICGYATWIANATNWIRNNFILQKSVVSCHWHKQAEIIWTNAYQKMEFLCPTMGNNSVYADTHFFSHSLANSNNSSIFISLLKVLLPKEVHQNNDQILLSRLSYYKVIFFQGHQGKMMRINFPNRETEW